MTQLAIRTVHDIAIEIKSIEAQAYNFVLRASIEVGERLTEAKELLPHGEWGVWLKDNVDYSQSKANDLMKIYREYGNSNSQALGNLEYTKAVALLALPADEREQFVEENNVQDMSTRDLQKVMKDLKAVEKKLKESRMLADQTQLERDQLAKSLEEMERKSLSHYELAESYKNQLAEASAAGDNEEEARLQAALSKSEKELADKLKEFKKLEAELKKKPVETTVTVEVEKVPEAIEKELEELRRAVSKQANAKFKVCFESLIASFNLMLASLTEIKDEEELTKCKGAAAKLFSDMAAKL